MKKLLLPLILFICFVIVVLKLDTITDYTEKLVTSRPKVTIDYPNIYASNNDFLYVKKSKTFVPYSKGDIMNILYSIFDNGYDTFTFYCPSEYTTCIEDVEQITGDQTIITDIGNYVHPYNNFTNLKIITDSLGEVDIIVNHSYTTEMIRAIDAEIDKIFNQELTDDMDIQDKILKMHDYIIDKVEYDINDENQNSGNAYGALVDGKAKCAGYADAMALVLSRLGLKNFKVASEKHVWNAIYIDDDWTQIDLTWDDPIVEENATVSDTIRHKFYMVDTETLLSYDTLEHSFNKNVYLELR